MTLKDLRIPFTVLICIIGCPLLTHAQIGAADVAADWTVTDIDGTEHNLYTYLDDGYSVVLTASAVWSGAAWEFHEAGVLNTLYEIHGPAGLPGVVSNTTDDLMVIFMEADPDTDINALNGMGSGTQGDWTAGTSHPLIDLVNNSFLTDYGLSGFPNTWIICPNRLVQKSYFGYDSETMTVEEMYEESTQCSAAFGQVNPSIAAYNGPVEVGCFGGEIEVTVTLQNMGAATMESAVIEVFQAGIPTLSAQWTGSLSTYAFAEFAVGTVAIEDTENLTIQITSEDEDPENAQITQLIKTPGKAGIDVEVRFYTDFYPAESAWTINDSEGLTVASGGPYQPGNADPDSGGGPDANAVMVHNVLLPNEIDCYSIAVTDTEGDGLLYGSNPAGKFGIEVFFLGQSVSDIPLENFGFETEKPDAVQGDPLLSTSDARATYDWHLFPNPTKGQVTVQSRGWWPEAVELVDLSGKIVAARSLQDSETHGANYSLDFSGLKIGMYLIRLRTNTGTSDTKKLIISD